MWCLYMYTACAHCQYIKALTVRVVWNNMQIIYGTTDIQSLLPQAWGSLRLALITYFVNFCLVLIVTSVDAKHHGASLSERWNVTWVGNNTLNYNSPNQNADIH